jgi:outer membrane protein
VAAAWLTAAAPAGAQSFDVWGVLAPERPALRLPGDDAAAAQPVCAEADMLEQPAAQPQAIEPMTLHRAVAIALCNNPQARQAWWNVMAQAAQIGQVKAGWLPTVNVGLSKTRDVVESRNPATGEWARNQIDAKGKNVTFNWLLFDFGTRRANVTQAEQNLAAAMASHDATLQTVFAGTVQSWYEATATAASVRAALQTETSAEETLKAADARQRVGAINPVDVLQARTALSQARLARVRAQGNERTAVGALARAMALDVRTPLPLAPEAEAEPADARALPALSQELGALVGQALASHPSLRAARAQLSAAEARLMAIRTEGFPTLSVSYGNFLNGRPGTTLTSSSTHERLTAITVSIPLFEGLGRNYRQHEQQAVVKARQADVAAAQAQVGFDVWRGYQALEVETASLAATADLVRSARESFDAAKARYRAGAVDIVELLNAQRDDANAQQERIQALANWRVARLRLLGSLGELGFWAVGG